jgi:alkylated DNA repair dioxygenase AlkB
MSILGLTYIDEFLTASEQEAVLSEVNNQPWLNDLKRAVQHYGYKYDYRSRRIDESMKVGPLPDFALRISEKLMDCGLIETNPDQMIVNKYEPGQGIYPHIDCVPCFGDTIVTVSLRLKIFHLRLVAP